MRALVRTAFVILCLAAAPVGAAGFVEGVEDLPLMDGLEGEAGSAVVFDKPGGRIVEAFATGHVGRAEALAFYGATLPQLGWTPEKNGTNAKDGRLAFGREGERLSLEFREAKGALRVRFAIAPD